MQSIVIASPEMHFIKVHLWNHHLYHEPLATPAFFLWTEGGFSPKTAAVNLKDKCLLTFDIFRLKEVACIVINALINPCFLKMSSTFWVPSFEYLNCVMNF